jgi:hypothetical protein
MTFNIFEAINDENMKDALTDLTSALEDFRVAKEEERYEDLARLALAISNAWVKVLDVEDEGEFGPTVGGVLPN